MAKTYIEQEVRLMCVNDLVEQAGGKCMKENGLFPELFDFEAFLKTLPENKRRAAEATVELYKRSITNTETTTIRDSTDIYRMMKDVMQGLPHEEFWLINMNSARRVINRRRLSRGGIDQTTVDVRQVMKYALESNATLIAVCHNHPSGNITPSQPDKKLTEHIRKAAEVMNIRLQDHVIVTNEHYYSFHDQGMI